MSGEWKPTLVERSVLRMYFLFAKLSQGSESRTVITECVRTMGVRGSWHFMMVSFRVTKQLTERYGASTAEFLVGVSSLFMGCGFCTHGHVLAGTLLWFEEHGTLHPLDPYSADALLDLTDTEIRERLEQMLSAPEHAQLRDLLLRMQDLYLERVEEPGPDDPFLEACLWMWRWTTECTIVEGITHQPEDADPIHAIGKDRKLRERWETARKEAKAAS